MNAKRVGRSDCRGALVKVIMRLMMKKGFGSNRRVVTCLA